MEEKIIRDFYTALNQNDISSALKLCAPEIVRIEFEGSPSAGTFRGLQEMEAHMVKGRETWAEGGCEPKQFITVGGKTVVLVHVRVRLKSNDQWVEGDTGDVFTLRNGKITEFRTFFEGKEALEWAGA